MEKMLFLLIQVDFDAIGDRFDIPSSCHLAIKRKSGRGEFPANAVVTKLQKTLVNLRGLQNGFKASQFKRALKNSIHKHLDAKPRG